MIAVVAVASPEVGGDGPLSSSLPLLHDVVEDTEYTVEDIGQHFGRKDSAARGGV